MCPATWRRLEICDGPLWVLHYTEAGCRELVGATDMQFGTVLAALLQSGNLVIRMVEELAIGLFPPILVRLYVLMFIELKNLQLRSRQRKMRKNDFLRKMGKQQRPNLLQSMEKS